MDLLLTREVIFEEKRSRIQIITQTLSFYKHTNTIFMFLTYLTFIPTDVHLLTDSKLSIRDR